MIQPNELRIGNLVHVTNSCYGTGDYKVSMILVDSIATSDDITVRVMYKDIDPILLTPELLARCGFKANNDYKAYELRMIDGSIMMDDDRSFQLVRDRFEIGWASDCICNYLHQLQNLYYALTGDELEVSSS